MFLIIIFTNFLNKQNQKLAECTIVQIALKMKKKILQLIINLNLCKI